MVNQSRTFGFVVLLTVVGLAVMLYGVTLNNGASLNGPMLAGGGVLVAALAVLVGGIASLDEPETASH
jgi:hypothetical protein